MNRYKLLILKRSIEDLFIWPFILIGRLIAMAKPMKEQYRVFFIFPYYHTGGAELFNMRLTHAVGGKDTIVFFTRRSIDERFLHEFRMSGCVIRDISSKTDNKLIYFINLIYRGIISQYINSQKRAPIVFNGQSNFGYKLSPWIRKNVCQIEFIHTFSTFSYIRVPFIPFYTTTISSSQKTINDHLHMYSGWNIPEKYKDRFKYILYGIELPPKTLRNFTRQKLTVLFVGRGSPEKRVYLVAQIASFIRRTHPNYEFVFMGDVEGSIPDMYRADCITLGNISDPQRIHETYMNAHILILTSIFEGFPLVVMEAMARGLVILSTSVGDVPFHVKKGINGHIIEAGEEEKIVAEAVDFINNLEPEKMFSMSQNNIKYAFDNFGIDRFNQNYRKLFQSLEQK